jgi:TetR/AcrR family transcriptional regulator
MSRTDRRQQILEAFALMLEESPGSRITTAALARQVGVSEAALYRHFPSKAKMIEGLIEFMEASIFTRITRILEEETSAESRCRNLLWLLLTFAERNPGFARLLAGDAASKPAALADASVFDRLETQLRQIIGEVARAAMSPITAATRRRQPASGGCRRRTNQFVRATRRNRHGFHQPGPSSRAHCFARWRD